MTVLILQFLFVCSFGQAQQTTTILLSIGDCREGGHGFYGIDTDSVSFYRLPEDTLAFRVSVRAKRFPIKLTNTPVADYRIAYRNVFRQLVVKQIRLTDQKTNSIRLCADSVLNYSKNTLAKLQDQDTISIYLESQGCESSFNSKILIRKEGDNFVARLYEDTVLYRTKRKMIIKGWGLIKTMVLTTQNIQDFQRFENEVSIVWKMGCTTEERYEIKSKYWNLETTDGDCDWWGYSFLKRSFFGKKI
ncbi:MULTISPECIES: hypothetical protein [Niastella]|uniref:Uncharacterized protein n=1 Tax=Niastella soli TaxID=2821487 RepID=A0ABS3YRH6_9BACT|nr:hypothetical protein [Niastella soli]MBO9200494.1 hypothetical protein [Niastella soli]